MPSGDALASLNWKPWELVQNSPEIRRQLLQLPSHLCFTGQVVMKPLHEGEFLEDMSREAQKGMGRPGHKYQKKCQRRPEWVPNLFLEDFRGSTAFRVSTDLNIGRSMLILFPFDRCENLSTHRRAMIKLWYFTGSGI